MSIELTQHLLELNQQLLNSIFAGDWTTYANLCDDRVTCFEPEGMGHLIEGLSFHKYYFELSSNDQRGPVQVTMAAPVVKFLGNDVALVLYTRLVQILTANGPQTKRVEELRVWHRQSQGWKLAHLHRSVPS